MSFEFLHYDVFTDEPLTGNQLAVFLDGRGLTTDRMQAIAREMNFSESTFILPPETSGTDVRMRIFTPATEMPMAGHPTIGSTFAPEFGIVEDPATGSASGPLGCYLVRHRLVSGEAARRIVSLQGVAMGRPIRIHVSIASRAGEIMEEKVGGTAVLVGRGDMLV